MTWVDLSLFYAKGPRSEDDPEEVQNRGVVLWGEGVVHPAQPGQRRSLLRTNLGSGIQLVKVIAPLDNVRGTLTNPSWDYVVSSKPLRVRRFRMGLTERPSFWLCPFSARPDPHCGHAPRDRQLSIEPASTFRSPRARSSESTTGSPSRPAATEGDSKPRTRRGRTQTSSSALRSSPHLVRLPLRKNPK
jgi:hypothetical protein